MSVSQGMKWIQSLSPQRHSTHLHFAEKHWIETWPSACLEEKCKWNDKVIQKLKSALTSRSRRPVWVSLVFVNLHDKNRLSFRRKKELNRVLPLSKSSGFLPTTPLHWADSCNVRQQARFSKAAKTSAHGFSSTWHPFVPFLSSRVFLTPQHNQQSPSSTSSSSSHTVKY